MDGSPVPTSLIFWGYMIDLNPRQILASLQDRLDQAPPKESVIFKRRHPVNGLETSDRDPNNQVPNRLDLAPRKVQCDEDSHSAERSVGTGKNLDSI